MHYEAPIRKPLVTGDKSYHDVTVDVSAPVEGAANLQWWIVFGIGLHTGHFQSRMDLDLFGLILIPPYFGMFSQFRLTSLCPWYFGGQVCFLILQ